MIDLWIKSINKSPQKAKLVIQLGSKYYVEFQILQPMIPRNCCDRIWEKGRKESQTGEELVVQLRGPRGHNLYLIPPRKNALQ